MLWVSKVIVPALLVLGAGTAVVMAEADGNQPPFGKGGQPPFGKFQPGKGDDKKFEDKKKDDKKVEEKKGEKKEGQPGDKKGPRPDATVDAWVKTLIEKITDPHDTVRESARGALVGVGPAALPALQKLADGDDSAKAVAARKLINAIQGQGRGPGQPGQPGQPGGPRPAGGMGMGPMGPPPGGMGPMGQPGMNPGGGRGGPGGFPGMGPGGGGRGGFGGFGRGGREASNIEVAPMPRNAR